MTKRKASDPTTQGRLEQVLALAEMGFRVHPLISGGKKPVVAAWPLEATTDPDTISRWYRVDNGRNWGIATGRGLLTVDIDVKKGDGEASWKKFVGKRKLPKTVEARSPTGGRHSYFWYDDTLIIGNSVGTIAEYVDIRADGGFVACPPSTTPNGEYTWIEGHSPFDVEVAEAPKWLLEAVKKVAPQNVEWTPLGGDLENGNRNNTIFHHVLSLAKQGLPMDMSMEVVDNWLRKNGVTDMPNQEIVATVNSAYKHAQKKAKDYEEKKYLYSDAGNGDRFCDEYAESVIYVAELDSWFVWNEKYWKKDVANTVTLLWAEDLFKRVIKEAVDIKDEELRAAIIKYAVSSTNQSKLKSTLENARKRLTINPEILDSQWNKITVRNGTLNLLSQQLEPFDPSDYFTKMIEVDYDESAECPNFINWLNWAFAGDQDLISYVQMVVGRGFFGNPTKELFFAYGPPDTGKSTLMRVIEELSGSYAENIKSELILSQGKPSSANEASPELAKLFGVRFAVGSDMPSNRWFNDATIKSLTGLDKVTARALYKEPITFTPQFSMWLFGNHRPKVNPNEDAVFKRMRIIPFKVQIPEEERNYRLYEEQFEPELSGILRWFFEGAIKHYHDHGDNVPIPQAVKAELVDYKRDINLVQQFIDEGAFKKNPGGSCSTKEAYVVFSRWVTSNYGGRFNPVNNIAFTREVVKILECALTRSHGQSKFLGLKVDPEFESATMNDEFYGL